MHPYKSLLFLHGHVADAATARALAGPDAAPATGPLPSPRRPPPARRRPGVLASLWYLGGLDDLDPHAAGDAVAHGSRLAGGCA